MTTLYCLATTKSGNRCKKLASTEGVQACGIASHIEEVLAMSETQPQLERKEEDEWETLEDVPEVSIHQECNIPLGDLDDQHFAESTDEPSHYLHLLDPIRDCFTFEDWEIQDGDTIVFSDVCYSTSRFDISPKNAKELVLYLSCQKKSKETCTATVDGEQKEIYLTHSAFKTIHFLMYGMPHFVHSYEDYDVGWMVRPRLVAVGIGACETCFSTKLVGRTTTNQLLCKKCLHCVPYDGDDFFFHQF
jgi:hypothetical protein